MAHGSDITLLRLDVVSRCSGTGFCFGYSSGRFADPRPWWMIQVAPMVKQDYRCLAYHPPMLTTVLEERDLNNGGCKRTLSFPLACSKSHPEKRTHKKGNESNFETLSLPYGIPFGRLTTLPHSSQPHSPSTTSLLRTETSSFPQTFQAVYLQLPVLVP